MTGFTDIHHHLLYGLDDGPRTADEMERMLVAAFSDNIRHIVVTPHVTPGIIPFDESVFHERLEEARALCKRNRLDIELSPGAEILYTPMTSPLLRQKKIPSLNHTEYVLVEFVPDVSREALEEGITSLFNSGFWPILAHVERYRCFLWHPRLAKNMKQRHDVLYQVNCASIVEGKNVLVRRFCRQMLEEGLIDVIATDAHDTAHRPSRMKEAYRVLAAQYGADYAAKLTRSS